MIVFTRFKHSVVYALLRFEGEKMPEFKILDKDMLKKKQAKMTEMLFDFADFCDANNLQYVISFGSALGAYRHKGFIPWDDDIDVDMPIEDIKKMCEIWEETGPKEKYFLQTQQTDPNLPWAFPRWRMNNTTDMEPNCEFIPLHWGLSLDIFPLFNVPSNPNKQAKVLKILHKANSYSARAFLAMIDGNELSDKEKAKFMKKFLKGIEKLYRLSVQNTESCSLLRYCTNPQKAFVDKSIYFPICACEYEGRELKGPGRIEDYLRFHYGDDFMTPPPVEERKGHGAFVDLENHYTKYVTYSLS